MVSDKENSQAGREDRTWEGQFSAGRRESLSGKVTPEQRLEGNEAALQMLSHSFFTAGGGGRGDYDP